MLGIMQHSYSLSAKNPYHTFCEYNYAWNPYEGPLYLHSDYYKWDWSLAAITGAHLTPAHAAHC